MMSATERGGIGQEAGRETGRRSDASVQGPAIGEGTEIAMVKGDAIDRGVVSTSSMTPGMSGEGSALGTMSVHAHAHESDTGGEGAGHRTTSMRDGETEFKREITAPHERQNDRWKSPRCIPNKATAKAAEC